MTCRVSVAVEREHAVALAVKLFVLVWGDDPVLSKNVISFGNSVTRFGKISPLRQNFVVVL